MCLCSFLCLSFLSFFSFFLSFFSFLSFLSLLLFLSFFFFFSSSYTETGIEGRVSGSSERSHFPFYTSAYHRYIYLTSTSTHSKPTALACGKQLSIYTHQYRHYTYLCTPWGPSPPHRNHYPSQTTSPSRSSLRQSRTHQTTNTDSTDLPGLP